MLVGSGQARLADGEAQVALREMTAIVELEASGAAPGNSHRQHGGLSVTMVLACLDIRNAKIAAHMHGAAASGTRMHKSQVLLHMHFMRNRKPAATAGCKASAVALALAAATVLEDRAGAAHAKGVTTPAAALHQTAFWDQLVER